MDRDHLIGHAYFLPLRAEPTFDNLKEIFDLKVIPLLGEYFYADLGRVGLVLGDAFVQPASTRVVFAQFSHHDRDQLSERTTYRLTPMKSISTADFRAVYESPS